MTPRKLHPSLGDQKTVTLGSRLEMCVATYNEVLEQALAAERAGYRGAWMGDHISYELEIGNPDNQELWTTMAALARDTKEICLAPHVLDIGWRNVGLTAKMAAMLDGISGGRLDLSIGVGNIQSEWDTYSWEWLPSAKRIRGMAEAIRARK